MAKKINEMYEGDKPRKKSRTRRAQDVYGLLCSCATPNEIQENDYNLNILRYVDTFEEEKPVDLDTVSSKLKTLGVDMKTTDESIAKFCDELGIATPF